jgi:hypothetical protein
VAVKRELVGLLQVVARARLGLLSDGLGSAKLQQHLSLAAGSRAGGDFAGLRPGCIHAMVMPSWMLRRRLLPSVDAKYRALVVVL